MSGPLRETFSDYPDSLLPSLLPEVTMLGWSRFPQTRVKGLSPHRHPAYEFCYLVDGSVTWWAEGVRYPLRRGEMYLTRPNELHGGWDEMMHPCELYWVVVRIAAEESLPGLSLEQTRAIKDALDSEKPRCFPAPPTIATHFENMRQEFRQPGEVFARMNARASLHQLLTLTARARQAALETSACPAGPSAEIAAALGWMTRRLHEPFSIQDVAEAVGLPESRFYERFLTEVGLPPAEWRIRQRISCAETLLINDETTITMIAHTLGFASSQHFATAFKKYTGWTPSAYRQRHRWRIGASNREEAVQ